MDNRDHLCCSLVVSGFLDNSCLLQEIWSVAEVTAEHDLHKCLSVLSDSRIERLMRHVDKDTPILCGCEIAGDSFVYEGRADPVILACFEDVYPELSAYYDELHPDTIAVYEEVSTQVLHSGYANALIELSQHDVKSIVRQIVKERGL